MLALFGPRDDKQDHAQGYYVEGTDSSDPSTQASFAAYRDLYKDACYSAKNHDAADLCAQWRAAIAAEKAAVAAQDGVFWSKIGTLLSAIGLFALLITIAQGRAALRRARKANKISSKTAQRQLRAYVFIERIEIVRRGGTGAFVFSGEWKNSGSTPADRIMAGVQFVFARPNWRGGWQTSFPEQGHTVTTLGPGQIHQILDYEIPVGNQIDKWRSGEVNLFVFAEARFVDAFGKDRITLNRFRAEWKPVGKDIVLMPEDVGNSYT